MVHLKKFTTLNEYNAAKDTLDRPSFAFIEETRAIEYQRYVPPKIYSFGGLQVAAGPLAYENGAYVMKSDWNHDSFNSVYGKNNGSTYFNFIEMGQLFEKADFSTSDGDIDNLLDPFDGWRLPSKTELENIFIGSSRDGSTVNGNTNKHFAFIQLTGVTHADSDTPNGLLLFPDGETIVGKSLSVMDDLTKTTDVTLEELNIYLNQGCVFLPASGFYGGWQNKWNDPYYGGSKYWMKTGALEDSAYNMGFVFAGISFQEEYSDKLTNYLSIRLVKPIA